MGSHCAGGDSNLAQDQSWSRVQERKKDLGDSPTINEVTLTSVSAKLEVFLVGEELARALCSGQYLYTPQLHLLQHFTLL